MCRFGIILLTTYCSFLFDLEMCKPYLSDLQKSGS